MSNNKNNLIKYVVVTALCGLFSVIYECFSHNVYSVFMVYLFMVPLVLGVIPQLVAVVWPKLVVKNSWPMIVRSFAIATISTGMVLQGIFEIYGTSVTYVWWYFVTGFILLGLSTVMWMISLRLSK